MVVEKKRRRKKKKRKRVKPFKDMLLGFGVFCNRGGQTYSGGAFSRGVYSAWRNFVHILRRSK